MYCGRRSVGVFNFQGKGNSGKLRHGVFNVTPAARFCIRHAGLSRTIFVNRPLGIYNSCDFAYQLKSLYVKNKTINMYYKIGLTSLDSN